MKYKPRKKERKEERKKERRRRRRRRKKNGVKIDFIDKSFGNCCWFQHEVKTEAIAVLLLVSI